MKKPSLLIVLLFAPFFCSAALIDHGTYLEDTAKGMYWLKLSETAGLSYGEVEDMTALGGSMEGWYFPSWNQARDFYKINFDLNLESGNFIPTGAEIEKINLLNSYMGDLMVDRGEPGQYSGSYGFISGGYEIKTYLYSYGTHMSDSTGSISTSGKSWKGSLLHRLDAPPVPLPAALWLFVGGLLGLVGMATRKKAT